MTPPRRLDSVPLLLLSFPPPRDHRGLSNESLWLEVCVVFFMRVDVVGVTEEYSTERIRCSLSGGLRSPHSRVRLPSRHDLLLQSDVYSASRRAFTSEGAMANKFPVPGGECLRNEAVANTASIYSTFLLQVSPRKSVAMSSPRLCL